MSSGGVHRANSSRCAEFHASTVFVLTAAAALLAAYDLYLLALDYF